MKERFVDKVKILTRGGDGGNGCMSGHREKFAPMGGPDGGNGGDGGSVIFECDERMTDFLPFKFKVHFKAARGQHGKGSTKHGKRGSDCIVKVPRGTIVYDAESGEARADMVNHQERFVAARGGRGGRGNAAFSSAIRKMPRFAENGEPAEEIWYKLELKLLADIGIVGFPNAGKSTLLSRVSAAHPKIASYPFTTITPNLGVVNREDGDSIVFADVPGLIEGAHLGIGLGLFFLRHIERTRLLIHMIDISEVSLDDPFDHYNKLRRELELYKPALVDRPEIVVFNKIDLIEDRSIVEALKDVYRDKKVFFVSCLTEESVQDLLESTCTTLKGLSAPQAAVQVKSKTIPREFQVRKENEKFIVDGSKIERLMAMIDMTNDEAIEHLQRTLKKMNVEKALVKLGAKEGDIVSIAGEEFDFSPD